MPSSRRRSSIRPMRAYRTASAFSGETLSWIGGVTARSASLSGAALFHRRSDVVGVHRIDFAQMLDKLADRPVVGARAGRVELLVGQTEQQCLHFAAQGLRF